MIKVATREREGEPKKPTRYFSKKQEDAVAKAVSGHRNANSGATPFQPGDVTLGSLLLIECKTKMKSSDSISIRKEWLEKNLQEAVFSGKKYNLLAFNFGPNESNYYILNQELFYEFLEFLKTKYPNLID